MATVITIQPSTAGPAPVTSFQQSHSSLSSDIHLSRHLAQQMGSTSTSPSADSIISTSTLLSRGPGRDGTSCDACLRRKSRCAMNEMVNKCYSCDFHRQECTFTLSAGVTTTTSTSSTPTSTADLQSRKRKLDDALSEDTDSIKRQSIVAPTGSKLDISLSRAQSQSMLSGYMCQLTQHIGLTTDLEPTLLDFLPLDQNDEAVVATAKVRKYSDDGTFMRMMPPAPMAVPSVSSLDAVESLVAPYGSTLVEKYFTHVHPTFPILVEDAFRQSYRARKGITPLLLSSVYVLALKFLDVGSGTQTVRRPDVGRLESTALKLLTESLPHSNMSTIQAGLLLMQNSSLNTAALNAQLVSAGFELGLHQDCSNWRMETWEKGLRKRLAWALYMQDKWCSLVHGRPSHIFASNWTVKDLVEQDFLDSAQSDSHQDDSPVGHGPLLFCHMVALTTILSDILDRFYTLQAIEDFRAAGNNCIRMILDKAKPAQIRLKEWFAMLPAELKMEPSCELLDTTTEENWGNGALHLAYFATEITLHRCIVRSLNADTADSYLSHICRSAAKTRLISAMDFINRLRPAHLRSFWPAASRTNFALIGSFGILLRITAPTKEEAEFYRLRLCEYRWTLSVSCKNAEFLAFALESLDNATTLGKHVPEKPGIDELMANSAKSATHRLSRVPNSSILLGSASTMDAEPMMDSARGGTSSVISGLASPATSASSEELEDSIPPL